MKKSDELRLLLEGTVEELYRLANLKARKYKNYFDSETLAQTIINEAFISFNEKDLSSQMGPEEFISEMDTLMQNSLRKFVDQRYRRNKPHELLDERYHTGPEIDGFADQSIMLGIEEQISKLIRSSFPKLLQQPFFLQLRFDRTFFPPTEKDSSKEVEDKSRKRTSASQNGRKASGNKKRQELMIDFKENTQKFEELVATIFRDLMRDFTEFFPKDAISPNSLKPNTKEIALKVIRKVLDKTPAGTPFELVLSETWDKLIVRFKKPHRGSFPPEEFLQWLKRFSMESPKLREELSVFFLCRLTDLTNAQIQEFTGYGRTMQRTVTKKWEDHIARDLGYSLPKPKA